MTTSIQQYSNIATNPKSNYCYDNLTKPVIGKAKMSMGLWPYSY